jgi:3'-phosphoadenosine 5'-phosphosulfate sulfotransferase
MLTSLQLQAPSEYIEISFINYIKYEINNKRVEAGLTALDTNQAREYLRVSWDYANKLGILRTPTGT